jgi:transposase InsO family protein
LVAGYAAPPQPQRPQPAPERHLDVDHPGQLVQLDCCCIGRLSATTGTVWQDTAIDVASAHAWARLQVTRRNPSAVWTSQLARRVASDLAGNGWPLERVMSDNASEFRSATFQQTIAALDARHSFIRAGRPQTNGCVERVQQTILEECWKPAFARYLIPRQTGLRLDLERYLRYSNTERAHTGRWTRGRTPEQVLGKAKLWQKKR